MPEIALFVEDEAHRKFLEALIDRISKEQRIVVSMRWENVRRGHGAVIRELGSFLRDLQMSRRSQPDLVIAATDANCKGFNDRQKDVLDVIRKSGLCIPAIAAIPDPHIERWLLLDSAAFKSVFKRGCDAPDRKCEKGRYKKQLIDAIRGSGHTPSFGGIEFTDELVKEMDLERLERTDISLGQLLADLRNIFQGWKSP
jgi:hypothetical protein